MGVVPCLPLVTKPPINDRLRMSLMASVKEVTKAHDRIAELVIEVERQQKEIARLTASNDKLRDLVLQRERKVS